MPYKVCPQCGRQYPPDAFDCEFDFCDLTQVPITQDEEPAAPAPAAAAAGKLVRICPVCGLANPANARKCRTDREDLSDVMPTEQVQAQQISFSLVSMEDGYTLEIPEGETVIGRGETLGDYLAEKEYVHRRQAVLTLTGDRLTVRNLGKTNPTFVNNRACGTESVELHEGDELGLGGNCRNGKRQEGAAYFTVCVVRAEACT